VAASKLAWWHNEVRQAFAGKPNHPVTQALMPHVPEFGIEEASLQSVIDGCELDLTQTRYLDYPNLTRYCHLVAGVVGEVSAKIFGQTEAATTAYAHKLGQAFQLTNNIRDVGEDAMRGRIYLPVTELQQFDVKAHEILNRLDSERFQSLMQFQASRAHVLYDEALALLPANDWKHQKPGLMMASIYRTLLREIQAKKFPVLRQRVALTPLHKLWLAWKMQALGRF
jgi:phytoene synthase